MPELPEVETLRRQLQTALVGCTIQEIEIRREKSFKGEPNLLIGKTINRVNRIAKVLEFEFNDSFPKLLCHLKMTGQLIYQVAFPSRHSRADALAVDIGDPGNTTIDNNFNSKVMQRSPISAGNRRVEDKLGKKQNRIVGGHPTLDWVAELPSKHTRVIITFSDKSQLFFNDMRVFGWLKLVTNEEERNKELRTVQGLDPLRPQFTLEEFKKRLGKTKRAIKIALMDQAEVAGVGNIYANDALWDAYISPTRAASSLTDKEWQALWQSTVKVIKKGVDLGGATESTYRHLDGLGGSYQDHFLVYKQQGTACKRCGTILEKIKVGGRGTYYCSNCQV